MVGALKPLRWFSLGIVGLGLSVGSFFFVLFSSEENPAELKEIELIFSVDDFVSSEQKSGVPFGVAVTDSKAALTELRAAILFTVLRENSVAGTEPDIAVKIVRGGFSGTFFSLLITDQSGSERLSETYMRDYLRVALEEALFTPLQLVGVDERQVAVDSPNRLPFALLAGLGVGFAYAVLVLLVSQLRAWTISSPQR